LLEGGDGEEERDTPDEEASYSKELGGCQHMGCRTGMMAKNKEGKDMVEMTTAEQAPPCPNAT